MFILTLHKKLQTFPLLSGANFFQFPGHINLQL